MYLDLYYKTERTLPLKAAIFFSLNSCQKATPFWFVYVRLQSKPACLPTWWNVDIFFVVGCPLSEKNIECFYLKLKGISLGKTVFCYSVCIFYFSQITKLDVIFMMHHESNYLNNPQMASTRQNWRCKLQTQIIHFGSENSSRHYCCDLSLNRSSKGT